MLGKTHFAPALTEQHLFSQSQKYFAGILHQPAVERIFCASQELLTVFTVVSGVPESLENLGEMGIYLGQSHE